MNQLLPFVSFRKSRRALKRGCQEERLGGRDSPGVWDGHAHAPVFKMDNQGGPTVWRRELCPMFCGGLDGSGVWRRTDTCECMAESLHCSPETITPLFAHREYSKYKIQRSFKRVVFGRHMLPEKVSSFAEFTITRRHSMLMVAGAGDPAT